MTNGTCLQFQRIIRVVVNKAKQVVWVFININTSLASYTNTKIDDITTLNLRNKTNVKTFLLSFILCQIVGIKRDWSFSASMSLKAFCVMSQEHELDNLLS